MISSTVSRRAPATSTAVARRETKARTALPSICSARSDPVRPPLLRLVARDDFLDGQPARARDLHGSRAARDKGADRAPIDLLSQIGSRPAAAAAPGSAR